MSKKKLDFDKLSALKPKKSEPKIDSDSAVKSIHTKGEERKKVKRITIDLPFSLYVDIKKQLIESEQTMKDYFVNLAEDDLRK